MRERESKKQLIAERFREGRRLSGLSQSQLAKLMGWHRPTVSQIETGDRNLSSSEAADVARHFDVELSWLLAEEDGSDSLNAARLQLAARELNKLKPEELDRLLALVASMRRESSPE
jgi:transcriptional regulator with XRE-family HTH domain